MSGADGIAFDDAELDTIRGGWDCSFSLGGVASYDDWADTAPMAVARAALKALGVDVEGVGG